MTRIRLVAFDLDGTLTRGQTCLQAIAAAFGFADQMSVWEHARTDEEIAARAGVWEHLKHRNNREITAPLADIPLAPGTSEGIAALHRAGIGTVIVSLALTPNVTYFARRLGIDAIIATKLDGNGGFHHVFPATKPILLARHAHTLRTINQALADGAEISVAGIARTARTAFLYRHRDLLEQLHAACTQPRTAAGPSRPPATHPCMPTCSPRTNAPPARPRADVDWRDGSPNC